MVLVVKMNEEKELPQRKSVRLRNFDYNSVGAYFVTICTENRRQILSLVVGGVEDVAPYKTTFGDIAIRVDIQTLL